MMMSMIFCIYVRFAFLVINSATLASQDMQTDSLTVGCSIHL